MRSVVPKKIAGLSRWLHLYLSAISFSVVLFFSATGFTLNHPDWFEPKPHVNKSTGKINHAWVAAGDTSNIKKMEILEYLRTRHKLQGHLSDFHIDSDLISISLNGPGYAADVRISRNDALYTLVETSFGLVAVMNDLHKGRDTGKGWSVVIDATALFLCFVSLSGIIMLFFMGKKRLGGYIFAAIGAMLAFGLYSLIV